MSTRKERYVTDEHGPHTDVILELAEYRKMLGELGELEAIRAYDMAKASDEEVMLFPRARGTSIFSLPCSWPPAKSPDRCKWAANILCSEIQRTPVQTIIIKEGFEEA